nr:CatB-related O-acetyltransferase [Exiguobacterium sp. s150]
MIKKIIKYILLQKIRLKYINCTISTSDIGRELCLGKKSSISKNVSVRNRVSIGNHSYINSGSYISEGVKIGNFTSISYDCKISPSEHPTNFISTSPRFYGNSDILNNQIVFQQKKGSEIGNDVWIGANCIILRGVNIGDGAIVAAGSIVTKDVLPYSIVGGVPAKLIKMRFDDDQISFLLGWEWWNLTDENIANYKGIFMAKDEWYSAVLETTLKERG